MTQIPAGWYPDPAGSGQRYWDGRQWTPHVHPGYPLAPSVQPARPGATTPDGQALSGWWARVGAFVVDQIILDVIVILIGFPQVRVVAHVYQSFVSEALRHPGAGSPSSSAELMTRLAGPIAVLGLIALVVNFIYNVGFLKWRAATPGKLLLGLRVRRREVPGPLPWGTVLLRWLGQNWPSFLFLVPVLNLVVGFYPWVDDLWPLWDGKRQALHDKVAGTNVVRARG